MLDILKEYRNNNPGVLTNLKRILSHGQLANSGKMIILPVDQGFEHGPDKSFAINPDAYDPLYHIELAIEAGLNAYAAPLGMLEVAAAKYPGRIPLILKMNSANSLLPRDLTPTQAVTASVEDALRLGCSAIGFTIYPGSHNSLEMIEQIKDLSFKAKQYGLAVVIWSYPRGGDLTPTDQTAIDICSYAAHMAALIGAHIIKVKLPSEHIALEENKKIYNKQQIDISSITARVKHVVKACFNGRRMVVFSGGTTKNANTILEETESIASGGGNGSIIGRNIFQRPREEALFLLQKMIDIYKGL